MRPAPMALSVIDADGDETSVLLLEGRLCFVKAHHLGRTYEGEVVRVEEHHDHLRADTFETYMA